MKKTLRKIALATIAVLLAASSGATEYQKFPDRISQEIQRKDPESFKLFNLLKGLSFPEAPGHVVAVPSEPSDGQIPVGDPDGGFLLKTLTAGTNITLTPSASSIQISATGGGGSYTDEQAQDAVGTILTDSASVDFTYNDAGNTITAAVLPGGVTLAGDVDGAANANDLDELAVEAELEAVLDLQDLQGAVTDAQVPNTITLDNLTQITTRDHGSLTGLSDDDHSIYALLAGRAGGQTLTGGTGAGDDLTLLSTSNTTKGNIHFGTASTYDQVNDRLGVGHLTPSNKLHTRGTADTDGATLEVVNTANNSPNLIFQRARGTVGAESVVGLGDNLGWMVARGYNSGYQNGGAIRFYTSEAWGVGSQGTNLGFFTTQNGTTALSQKMTLAHDGKLGINEPNPGARLEISDASTSLTPAIQITNTSTSGVTSKLNFIEFRGTDTVGTDKQAIVVAPYLNDGNWVNAGLDFATRQSDAVTQLLRLTHDAKVIIDPSPLSNPQGVLTFNATTGKKIGLYDDGTVFYGLEIQGGELRSHADTSGGAMHTWYSANIERMRLESDGDLGNGVTPSAPLHWKRTGIQDPIARFESNNATAIQVYETDTGNKAKLFVSDGASHFLLNSAQGDIGLTCNAGKRILLGDEVGGANTSVLTVDTANSRAGVNQISPAVSLDAGANTDALFIPKGTTAQRPTGVNGYIRHNTDIGAPEFYERAWTQFVGVLDRQVTQNDVVNTLTETSFYSFSVPQNVLDTQKMLRLTLYGDYLNNSGAGRTLRIRVKFGGTTYYNDVSGTIAASASRHPFKFEVLVGQRNAANVQSIGGYFSMGVAGGATTGIGDLGTFATNTTGFETPFYNDGAIDNSAGANTLEVTVQHSTNHASLSIRRQMAILEIM